MNSLPQSLSRARILSTRRFVLIPIVTSPLAPLSADAQVNFAADYPPGQLVPSIDLELQEVHPCRCVESRTWVHAGHQPQPSLTGDRVDAR